MAGMQGGQAGEWGYGRKPGQGPGISGVFEGVLVVAGPQAGGGCHGVMERGGVGGGGSGEIAAATRAVSRPGAAWIGFFADRAAAQNGGECGGHGFQSSR